MNSITLYENALEPAMEDLSNILAATPGLPARSFKSAMLSQMVNSKAAAKLMECTLPSFLNCAATFAGLGLMPDGVTGQAYMIPFAGAATPVIGYKGYNTLGDRAGRTIDGDVVRDGDDFAYKKGTSAFVDHSPKGNGSARITHAWGAAMANGKPPLISVLTIEELEAVRNKSPAGKKSDSPWMDLVIGRPAMYAKTAKRRLARGMPLVHGHQGNYHTADALEGHFEATGRPHYFLPGGDGRLHITDSGTGEQRDSAPPEDPSVDPTASPKLRAIISHDEGVREFENPGEWKAAMMKIVSLNSMKKGALEGIRKANAPYLAEAAKEGFGKDAAGIEESIAHYLKTAK